LLDKASPAEDPGRWLGAWLLLRKVRSAATYATVVAIVVGATAFLGYLPVEMGALSRLPFHGYLATDNGVARTVGFGAGTATFFVVYYGIAFLTLGPRVSIPAIYHMLGIRRAMLPFDAIAREHLRRWSKSPYAS
jgi:hypothetical protein